MKSVISIPISALLAVFASSQLVAADIDRSEPGKIEPGTFALTELWTRQINDESPGLNPFSRQLVDPLDGTFLLTDGRDSTFSSLNPLDGSTIWEIPKSELGSPRAYQRSEWIYEQHPRNRTLPMLLRVYSSSADYAIFDKVNRSIKHLKYGTYANDNSIVSSRDRIVIYNSSRAEKVQAFNHAGELVWEIPQERLGYILSTYEFALGEDSGHLFLVNPTERRIFEIRISDGIILKSWDVPERDSYRGRLVVGGPGDRNMIYFAGLPDSGGPIWTVDRQTGATTNLGYKGVNGWIHKFGDTLVFTAKRRGLDRIQVMYDLATGRILEKSGELAFNSESPEDKFDIVDQRFFKSPKTGKIYSFMMLRKSIVDYRYGIAAFDQSDRWSVKLIDIHSLPILKACRSSNPKGEFNFEGQDGDALMFSCIQPQSETSSDKLRSIGATRFED